MDKYDDSPTKSIDKLEQTTTHMAKMMKDEGEDGDDGIWINEDHNASEALIGNNCIHMEV